MDFANKCFQSFKPNLFKKTKNISTVSQFIKLQINKSLTLEFFNKEIVTDVIVTYHTS